MMWNINEATRVQVGTLGVGQGIDCSRSTTSLTCGSLYTFVPHWCMLDGPLPGTPDGCTFKLEVGLEPGD